MRLAVYGATGSTGGCVVEQALERGHDVVALVRNPHNVKVEHPRLTVLAGNPTARADVDRAIAGADAVVDCIGIGGKGDGKHTTVVSDSVAIAIEAMRTHGVRRLVCMSNIGTGGSGPRWLTKLVVPVGARWLIPILADKERMEATLRATHDVEWVCVRMAAIVDGPIKPVRVSDNGRGIGLRITAASAAQFLLDHLEGEEFLAATPSLSN